jgi:hypothetical protein
MDPRLPRGGETAGDLFPAASSGNDRKWPDSHWESLRELPEKVRGAKSLSDLSAVYTKVRIRFNAPHSEQAAVICVEAYNVVTSEWELVELPPKHRQSLADIGIGVVTKEAGSAIAKWLPAPTELDKLAELAKLLLAPEETLAPKFLGILAEVVAQDAGMPDFAAKWIGVLVEQAVRPLFEPEGARGALLACLEDFTAISDLGNGQMTSAVVNVALDRLSDELKKRMEQQAGGVASGDHAT